MQSVYTACPASTTSATSAPPTGAASKPDEIHTAGFPCQEISNTGEHPGVWTAVVDDVRAPDTAAPVKPAAPPRSRLR
jgi:hypothetical protein